MARLRRNLPLRHAAVGRCPYPYFPRLAGGGSDSHNRSMYRLRVFHAHSASPSEVVAIRAASEVLTEIPALLSRHPDCAHVEVLLADTRLFAVDCKGNRLSD